MPGFGDTTFIVLLALLLFGPKKLPVLARQLGKLMAEFRRASNEFRTQMEEELRISEQADRQKQIAAIEAAAPKPVEPIPEPEHPHLDTPREADYYGATGDPSSDLPGSDPNSTYDPYTGTFSSPESTTATSAESATPTPADSSSSASATATEVSAAPPEQLTAQPASPEPTIAPPATQPVPIASSGDLDLMPPSTGLPVPSSAFNRSSQSTPDAEDASVPTNGTHAEQAPDSRPVHG